jgi:hypothetical protein
MAPRFPMKCRILHIRCKAEGRKPGIEDRRRTSDVRLRAPKSDWQAARSRDKGPGETGAEARSFWHLAARLKSAIPVVSQASGMLSAPNAVRPQK